MSKKLWGGRFSQKTDKKVDEFNASIDFDKRLYSQDIAGSKAHANMLHQKKIITKKERDAIISGLDEILTKIESGKFRFKVEHEDIHMSIETALIKLIGDAGKKLHTARSRNDQVALDMRLFLRNELDAIMALMIKLLSSLASIAEDTVDLIMPGYTHLQRAQPIRLAHHLMAYFQMFKRDTMRLIDCRGRVNIMPLGSGALAGTTFDIDRELVAKQLGFSQVSSNSLDSVSDRDFVLEFLSAASMIMMHLSRFSEEIIIWNSAEFNFIEISDAFTTGSSIMPQKKNPDVAELIRGKTGRIYGNLMNLLTTMKALPLAYNKDMQEDKEPLFDTVDTIKMCIDLFTDMLNEIEFNQGYMEESAFGSFSTATDLADYLAKKGVPFRESHRITGRIVKFCIENGYDLMTLPISMYKEFTDKVDDDLYDKISLESSVEGKISYGATCKSEVLRQIEDAMDFLKRLND
jgi:argininosuccinate lyase